MVRSERRESEGIRRDDSEVEGSLMELHSELLEDAIGLVHPDRHPTRIDRANRVTAELLALRPFVKPKSEPVAGAVKVPLDVWRVTLSETGIVVRRPTHLLAFHVVSRSEGASLTLFDAKDASNPSTGVMYPNVETRYPGIMHRTAIYAVIRGQMTVVFDYL